MATIVKLFQGSAEWHLHRLAHRNASETPAVLGFSPYTTPYQFWQQRSGRTTAEVTPAMMHGTATEPQARVMYETLTGNVMQPLVLIEGDYSASLDGITLDGDLVLEIKCPKSKDAVLLKDVRAGRIPIHVYWQVQHPLMVSGAQLAHVYVYDGKLGHLVEQPAEPECWGTIRQGWEAFDEYVPATHRRLSPIGISGSVRTRSGHRRLPSIWRLRLRRRWQLLISMRPSSSWSGWAGTPASGAAE